MNRIAIEVGSEPLVLQLSGEVELTITAAPARHVETNVHFANWTDRRTAKQVAETMKAALLRARDRVR